MPSTRFLVLTALLSTACADRIKIEDGASYGRVTVVKDWFTSAAVVETEGEPVMVDAGFRSKRMTKGLDAVGVQPVDVQAVILTHGHGDHLGAMDIYENAEVVGMAAEATLVEEETEGTVVLDQALEGDTLLTYGSVDFEVISVPGHTPGSAVVLVDGVLLMGDTAIIGRDGDLQPAPENRSDEPEQAIQSLVDLAASLEPRADEIDWIVPSHSAAVEGLQPLLDFAAANSD